MAIPFLSNIDLNKNQLLNHTLHNATANPSSPSEGQIYYNTSTDKVLVYNGSAWVSIAGDIESIATTTSNQLTVTSGTGPDVSLAIVTGAVANGGTALATGDQIYDFVTGLGYVESVTSGNTNTITIGGTAADPTISANTAAVANGSTNLATGDQIYDFVVGYADPAGTDNSTNVTLAGSLDYITISGQVITRNAINLATDVTGTLPIANGGTGQTTAAAAANALLNTSQGGSLTIGDSSDNIIIPGDLQVTGTVTTNNVETVSTSNGVIFEGNAADENELTLLAGTLTADRTVTLPDATGTVALTSELHDAVTLAGSYDYITLSGQQLTLNQIDYATDIVNTPAIPVPNNATITVSASSGLTGGGNFTTDQAINQTITISHADTSSQASVNNSGVTVIQDVTLDTYGHVTGLASVDLTSGINSLIDTKISATGYAATITDSVSGTTFNHGLGDDVIVQLYDATTKETVYADVERNGNYLNITFASTPTNSVRVLVQQIN